MNTDTVRLLRECSSGVKMGITAINDVLEKVKADELYLLLKDSRNEHEKLEEEIEALLEHMGAPEDEPHPIAQSMARMKSGAMLAIEESDRRIADLMTDGCNNGVKCLHRYINEYKGADERSRQIARRLVNIEERLAVDMRGYL